MSERAAAVPTSIELVIDALGAQGDGVAELDGVRAFVPLALPGERVRAVIEARTAEGLRARLLDIIEPMPERARPPCPHFGVCGGCALQHAGEALYAAFKRERVVQALAQRGIHDAPVAPMFRVPGHSRRRVRLAAKARRDEPPLLGFRAARGHAIVDLMHCPVATPAIERAMAPLRVALGPVLPHDQEIEIAITEAENGLDVLLFGVAPGAPERRTKLAALARTLGLARLSVQHSAAAPAETIASHAIPSLKFGGVTVSLPPDAFIQPTAEGEAAIVTAVSGAFAGARRVADLYCGLGTLCLPLAKAGARVLAVDASSEAIAALGAAARNAGLSDRVTATKRDLNRAPLGDDELARLDAVVFDPPRSGAAAQAGRLAASAVPIVVAVSCNPATFARDARTLIDGGYRLERVEPLDQFLWSPHVELIAVFRR